MNKKKSSGIIIVVGAALIVAVTVFTGFAAYKIIGHMRSDADEAYAAAVTEANMRRLAEMQVKQAADANKTSVIPVEVTVKVAGVLDATTKDGNSVGNVININGSWYVIEKSKTVSNEEDINNPDVNPDSRVTPPDTIIIDGEEYVRTDNTGSKDIDPDLTDPEGKESGSTVEESSQVPYVGTEYVVIDINGDMIYFVEKGDTLCKVSRLTGYSVQEIAEYNCIKNVHLIYAGQTLRIPADAKAIEYVKAKHDSWETNNQ